MNDHTILAIDLETTGTDPDDFVLEVAAAALDDELNVVGEFQSLVTEAATMAQVTMKLHPTARRMHEENGLLEELGREYTRGPARLSTPQLVELRLLEFLRDTRMRPGQLVCMGYSVHTDKIKFARVFPIFHWLASYQVFELGSVRRAHNLGGFQLKKKTVMGLQHRALEDVRSSIAELRALVRISQRALPFFVPELAL